VLYDEVGVLMQGQEAPVLGRTSGGDWLLIEYDGAPNNRGWIYAPIVSITPGEVPIVEIPPTVTPLMTETITNPGCPIPYDSNSYPAGDLYTCRIFSRADLRGCFPIFLHRGIPMGLVILIIGGIGVILAMLSIIRSR
jgi:uncharacterized protein YraI